MSVRGFAARMWGRWGSHYVVVLWIVAVLIVVIGEVVPVGAWLVVYFDASLAESAVVVCVGGAAVAVGVAFAFAANPRSRVVARWCRGDRSDPASAWEAAIVLASTTTRRAIGLIAVLHCGVTLPVAIGFIDVSGPAIVSLFVLLAALMVGGGLIVSLSVQVLVRPVLDDVSACLAEPVALPPDDLPLRRRLQVGVAVSCMLAGVGTGTVAASVESDEWQLAAITIAGIVWSTYMTALFTGGLITPTLAPVEDLTTATTRVRRGDFSQPLVVSTADEFGELALAFNEMQRGLAEREALHMAFGSYVDPMLARRLLESGSSVFAGEERVVSVFFADVRDFTSYAEGVAPGEAVGLLNRLFDVMVPVLHEHGGHANHYLGDGLLAIFGAPNPLEHHADAAVSAAVGIQRRTREVFGTRLRLGIGINSGPVIAGTVGGGGRHEFTVIGDTVNVAARVEQRTKDTSDAILMTDGTRAALSTPRPRSTKRGAFDLKGKSAKVTVYAVNPFPRSTR